MPEIVAHRGASADAPENTMAAFNLAWRHDADAVECDIHLTKDGRIAVIHDSGTKRVAGADLLIKDVSYGDLLALDVGSWKGSEWAGEKIPLLSELMASVPKGRKIYVEIKSEGMHMMSEFKSVVESSGLDSGQIVAISFSAETIALVREKLPSLTAYLLAGFEQDRISRAWSPDAEELINRASACRAHGLDLYACDGLTGEIAGRIRAAGLDLCVWTVNDPDMAAKTSSFGATAITTDRPGLIKASLRKPRK